jgi:hypothetical protein
MKLKKFIREFKLYELGIIPNSNSIGIINTIDNYLNDIKLIKRNDGVTEIRNNGELIALYTDEHGGMFNITTKIHKSLFKSFDIDNSLIKNFGECLSIIGYVISFRLNINIESYDQCYSLYD